MYEYTKALYAMPAENEHTAFFLCFFKSRRFVILFVTRP